MAQKLYQAVVIQAVLVSNINSVLVLVSSGDFLIILGKQNEAGCILNASSFTFTQIRSNARIRFEKEPY